MMYNNTSKNSYDCSRKSSDSSVVNLLSTDDEEAHSVTSEDEEILPTNAQRDDKLYLFRPSQQVDNKNILIGRILGPPCGCRRNCRDLLKKNQEIEIFSKFWSLTSQDQQNFYLSNCIQVGKKKKTKGPESRRTITAYYSVDNGGVDVNVCKNEFLNLHGLQRSKGRIDRIVKTKKIVFNTRDERGKSSHRHNKRNMKQNY